MDVAKNRGAPNMNEMDSMSFSGPDISTQRPGPKDLSTSLFQTFPKETTCVKKSLGPGRCDL